MKTDDGSPSQPGDKSPASHSDTAAPRRSAIPLPDGFRRRGSERPDLGWNFSGTRSSPLGSKPVPRPIAPAKPSAPPAPAETAAPTAAAPTTTATHQSAPPSMPLSARATDRPAVESAVLPPRPAPAERGTVSDAPRAATGADDSAAQAPARSPDTSSDQAPSDTLEVLQRQAHEPADEHDVHYQEQLLWSPREHSDAALRQLLLDRLEKLRTEFRPHPSSPTRDLFVQLALFGEKFDAEPEAPPLATLSWQSWESTPAEVWVRGERRDVQTPAPPTSGSDATPERPIPSLAQPVLAVDAAPPEGEPPNAKHDEEPAPTDENTRSSKTSDPVPLTRILAPQEEPGLDPTEVVLGRAFERMHKLLYCNTVGDGAQFVLSSLAGTIPSSGILIHLFDVSTRMLVVARAKGPKSETLLLTRTDPLGTHFDEALRRQETIKLSADSRSNPYGLWTRLGISLAHGLSTPILSNRRYLGALEVGRQAEEAPFGPAEVLALEYIAQQFADFLATRTVLLDDASLLPSS